MFGLAVMLRSLSPTGERKLSIAFRLFSCSQGHILCTRVVSLGIQETIKAIIFNYFAHIRKVVGA